MKLTNQQKSAIDHLLSWRVGALFMEPGTGKTRVALELIRACNDIDFVLWLGPLRTIRTEHGIPSISDEVNKWGGIDVPIRYVGVESISASDRIYVETREELARHNRVFCVVDESLKIKNYATKRTRHIIDLGTLCHYRIILNGTPLSRNIVDLWSQMEFLSPKILNMSHDKFVSTFCRMKVVTKRFGNRTISQERYITGYENLDYLYSLIRHYVYRCDLNLQITQQFSTEYYSLDEDCMREYQDIKDYYLSDDTLDVHNDNVFFSMTQQMQHAYSCSSQKFDIVRRIFERHGVGNCITFTKYITSRERLQELFPSATILSYQKESYGLNLQDFNVTIYFDKVWDYALRIQAGRRTYRTGQNLDCHYYDLTGNVGLERLIDKNIEKKISMSEYFKKKSIQDIRKDL